MKRTLCALLVLLLVLGSLTLPAAAGDWVQSRSYVHGTFSDVQAADWYAGSVATVYSYGLMEGSGSTFDPDGQLTVAETLALACRLYCQATGEALPESGSPWYQGYVDLALSCGILDYAYADYTAAVTRAEFVRLLSAALPEESLEEINTVDDGAIPDVSLSADYAFAVYRFYRAGLLTGDADGSFRPGAAIIRAEAAAVLARIVEPDRRVSLTLTVSQAETVSENTTGELTAAQIYAQCTPSVFYIEVYDEAGTALATGSGFFISADGVAVTNFHVIEQASAAKITTSDGEVYDVLGLYDYDEECDIALLQIDGSGFSCLPIAETAPAGGDTVYTLGAPLGLASTIANGIVSNPSRVYDGVTYIQTTASISSGSSGGALINAYGEVVGITTASLVTTSGISQNMNLAIPISQLSLLEQETVYPFSALAPSGDESSDVPAVYDNGAPNYSYITGQNCTSSFFLDEDRYEEGYVAGAGRYLYPYSVPDAAAYVSYLLETGFAIADSALTDEGTLIRYEKAAEDGTGDPIAVSVCVLDDFSGVAVYIH